MGRTSKKEERNPEKVQEKDTQQNSSETTASLGAGGHKEEKPQPVDSQQAEANGPSVRTEEGAACQDPKQDEALKEQAEVEPCPGQGQEELDAPGDTLEDPRKTDVLKNVCAEGRTCESANCRKTFHWRNNLIQHQHLHTGERPYKCPECENSFNDSSNLMSHQRIHWSEWPHVCFSCRKNFNQSPVLVQHSRLLMCEKPYLCLDCGKSFTQSTGLIICW
nr:zinc finger protein 135-like [Anser cygnoides]